MRSVLSILPTANSELASPTERTDAMVSFARVLMGLSHPVQFVSQAREVDDHQDWPRPPRLERRWFAVLTADDANTLEWRTRTLATALEGVGLRCGTLVTGSGDIAGDYRCHTSYLVEQASTRYLSSLVLRRWPREVAPGWLGQALSADLPVDLGLHIQPQDPQRIARFLKKQQQMLSEQDAGHQLGREDAERVRMKLIARTDRPVKVATAFTVRAPSPQLLKERVALLTYELGLTLSDARVVTFEQDRGLEATLPAGACRLLGAWHTLDCTSVASTWPFQPATINHANGAPLGTSHGMLVRLDPFDDSLESFGGVILAKVGAGKSYLLKLLARRLHGVEVLIVEQRNPPEYIGVGGAHTLSLADLPTDEDRAARLRDFVSALWATAKRDPRPRLLILDELWSLLRKPALATLVEEVARIGRHHYLSLWIATQQVKELLSSEQGLSVLNNAAIRVYLKQHGPDGELLAETLRLSAPARQYLRGASRGQALLDVSGMLIPVDIQATRTEHEAVSTDPREKYGRTAMGSLSSGGRSAAPVPVGTESTLVAAGGAAARDHYLDDRQ